MAHREGIREYLKDVQVHGVVYDWGCGTKPINKYLKPNDAEFINFDKNDYGHNKIVDVEWPENGLSGLPFADFAFCIEVLEHLWEQKLAMRTVYDNLKDGGILYLSQPFMYKVHKEDDRIRYTHHGLRQLLEEVGFTVEDIHPTVGDLDHAEGYIVKARK